MKRELKDLLKEIDAEARATASYTGRRKFADRVMHALGEVPREEFVPEGSRFLAYDNGPLPIGYGQTISQPYIVALMTDVLDITPDCVVLEVGTGSGYQAAVLTRLAHQVYSIEYVAELAQSASERLARLGYGNVEVRHSNGYLGWIEKAPFDRIIVTAAAPYIPQSLIDQLKPGGRMVIPVGRPYSHQELVLLTKAEDGTTETRNLLPVAFVPLVSEPPSDEA
ncbi:MAG: protein-L-isoaspartate(D-aspartate) O-methyltransferase [Gammaproteobacteria bacterium]|jgi:protein-L-isoaspartate(D-aspartate) O-methyltransferase